MKVAYSKTTWIKGDTISAQRMNKIEAAIEQLSNNTNAYLMVEDRINNNEDIQLNKTFLQIFNALEVGTPVFLKRTTQEINSQDIGSSQASRKICPVIQAFKYNNGYKVYISDLQQVGNDQDIKTSTITVFETDNPYDYPVLVEDNGNGLS